MNARLLVCVAPVALATLVALGCDKKSEGTEEKRAAAEKTPAKSPEKTAEKKPASYDDEKPKGEDDDKPGKPKSDAKDETELVELDLSSRGPEWKGWTMKAPAGAKVMDDMSNLRVSGKGCPITDSCPSFDLILSQKKPDLAAMKALQTRGAAGGGEKLTFQADTASLLEWTREGSQLKTMNFLEVVTVSGKAIGCGPLSSVVRASDLTAMKRACGSIERKTPAK